MKGATRYRQDGTIEHAGLWETPRWYKDDPDAPTVVKPAYLRLNERLALDFRDRVNNELVFFCDGEYRYWCGQRLKRKEGSYLLNNSGCFKYGEQRGRYQIDKETRIYAASDAVGEKARASLGKATISGKIQGLQEVATDCTEMTHYFETNEKFWVRPHITVEDKRKAQPHTPRELKASGGWAVLAYCCVARHCISSIPSQRTAAPVVQRGSLQRSSW